MTEATPIEWLALKPGAPIGARIWFAMKKKGLSGEELGKQATTSRANISNWIAGRNEPGARNLKYLAKALGVSMDWLAGGGEEHVDCGAGVPGCGRVCGRGGGGSDGGGREGG